jgi:hypothetical protein
MDVDALAPSESFFDVPVEYDRSRFAQRGVGEQGGKLVQDVRLAP